MVSMLMMSMFLSPAARRRTNSSRVASALLATGDMVTRYRPLDWSEHSFAAATLVPPGSSGPKYWIVAVPPSSPPQPATTMAQAAATTATAPGPARLMSLLSSKTVESPPSSIATRSSSLRCPLLVRVGSTPVLCHSQLVLHQGVHPTHPNGLWASGDQPVELCA